MSEIGQAQSADQKQFSLTEKLTEHDEVIRELYSMGYTAPAITSALHDSDEEISAYCKTLKDPRPSLIRAVKRWIAANIGVKEVIRKEAVRNMLDRKGKFIDPIDGMTALIETQQERVMRQLEMENKLGVALPNLSKDMAGLNEMYKNLGFMCMSAGIPMGDQHGASGIIDANIIEVTEEDKPVVKRILARFDEMPMAEVAKELGLPPPKPKDASSN